MFDSLGNRMKKFEATTKMFLPPRMNYVLRLDGKAFHSFTKGFDKPVDNFLWKVFYHTIMSLPQEIQNITFIYHQSDEISILMKNDSTYETEPWFNGNVQKIVSVSASIVTAAFNSFYNSQIILQHNKDHQKSLYDETFKCEDILDNKCLSNKLAHFDSRVFALPKEEVVNYMVWRQQDAVRNSIQGLGQAHFSHKQLMHKNQNEIQEMLFQEKGINWNDTPTKDKRGWAYYKKEGWTVDLEIPVFTADRTFIEQFT